MTNPILVAYFRLYLVTQPRDLFVFSLNFSKWKTSIPPCFIYFFPPSYPMPLSFTVVSVPFPHLLTYLQTNLSFLEICLLLIKKFLATKSKARLLLSLSLPRPLSGSPLTRPFRQISIIIFRYNYFPRSIFRERNSI